MNISIKQKWKHAYSNHWVNFSYEKCHRKKGVRCENSHTIEYFVCPPLSTNTAIIWHLIILVSFWSLCIIILFQFWWGARLKSAMLLTLFRPLTHWTRMSYTCPIGDKSGYLMAHSKCIDFCSAVKRLGFVMQCAVERYLVEIW
jgi:hypothetical protein